MRITHFVNKEFKYIVIKLYFFETNLITLSKQENSTIQEEEKKRRHINLNSEHEDYRSQADDNNI